LFQNEVYSVAKRSVKNEVYSVAKRSVKNEVYSVAKRSVKIPKEVVSMYFKNIYDNKIEKMRLEREIEGLRFVEFLKELKDNLEKTYDEISTLKGSDLSVRIVKTERIKQRILELKKEVSNLERKLKY